MDQKEFFSSSYSGDDAIPAFMKRLRAKALVDIEKLADREPGGEFELKLLTSAASFFRTRNSRAGRSQGDEVDQFCANRIIKNHMQNPDSQEILIGAVSQTTFSNIFESGHEQWELILRSSQFKETRAAAASELVLIQSQAMRDLCKQVRNQKKFDEGLARLKGFLESAEASQDLVPLKLKERGMPWLESSLKTVEQAINPPKPSSQNRDQRLGYSVGPDNPNRMIESRAQAVYDLLHPYVESLRD